MKIIRKSDILFAAVVVALCALLYVGGREKDGGNLTAVVTVNGVVIRQIDLSQVKTSYTFSTQTHPKTVIYVEQNAISFQSSECDNQLCVRSGKLTSKGATAVCLPARVVITLQGQDTPDAVTY